MDMYLCCGGKQVSYGKTVNGCLLAAQYSNNIGTKVSELTLALNQPDLCKSCKKAIQQLLDEVEQ